MNNNYNRWIELGLEKGLTDIEIHINEKTNLMINVYNQKVEQNEISKMKTAKIKGIFNGKVSFVSVENLSDNNISLMIDHLIDSAKHITANEPAIIYEGSNNYLKDDTDRFDFSKINTLDKIKLMKEIERGILNNPLVETVSDISYNKVETKTKIINTKGLNLERHNTYDMIYTNDTYKKNNQVKSGMSYQIVNKYDDIDKNHLINDNIINGTSQLGASTIKSNKYPVIIDKEQVGDLISSFSSIFSGEAAYRNLTKLQDKENEIIASSIVNLIDSPMHKESIFKYPFDNEGVACKERYWIKQGVFTGFSHNLKTAKIFKTNSTGNGFFNSIIPTNLVLEPGPFSFDELVVSIKDGVYITDLIGLHAGVETVSGDFSLQAAGFLIKNGQITKPVDMIVVSGNFYDLLKNITMIANDFKFGMSGVGSSSIKIKELMIAGE